MFFIIARAQEQQFIAQRPVILSTNNSRDPFGLTLRQDIPHEYLGYHRINIRGLKRPKIVTIMRLGPKPIPTVRILLNRNSVQAYEQLVSDISDAFGAKRKENGIVKMFTLKGHEVQGTSELFRDDIFIGVGGEPLSLDTVELFLNEIYPDNAHYVSGLMRHWDKDRARVWHVQSRVRATPGDKKQQKQQHDDCHLDSGFGSEDGNSKAESVFHLTQPADNVVLEKASQRNKKKTQSPFELKPQLLRRRKQPSSDKQLSSMPEEPQKRLLTSLLDRATAGTPRHADKLELHYSKNPALKETETQTDNENENQESNGKEADSGYDLKSMENNNRVTEPDNANKAKINETFKNETEQTSREAESQTTVDRLDLDNEENSRSKTVVKTTARKSAEKQREESARSKRGGIIQKSRTQRQVSNVKHVLEQYDLGQVLGDGNFAIVKQCMRKISSGEKQEFAMKIVDKSKLNGKENMIENEIAIMKLCDHPNIVKLYEEFETKDEIYLVMEFVKVGLLDSF